MTKRNECSEGFNAILKVTHGMALSGVSITCERKKEHKVKHTNEGDHAKRKSSAARHVDDAQGRSQTRSVLWLRINPLSEP